MKIIRYFVVFCLLILLSGCVKDSNGDVPIVYEHEKVDIYLFLGVALDIINDTVYEIFYENIYLGEFEPNFVESFNLSDINISDGFNKSLVMAPGTELIIFIKSKSGYSDGYKIYNKVINYIVPDKIMDIIIPEFDYLNEFRFEVFDFYLDKSYRNPENISVLVRPSDIYHFDINIDDKQKLAYFACSYDVVDVDVGIGLNYIWAANNADYFLKTDGMYELDNYFTVTIKTDKFFNETVIACYFIDEEYHIDEYKEIRYSAFDDNRNDLGFPNPSFNIILEMET